MYNEGIKDLEYFESLMPDHYDPLDNFAAFHSELLRELVNDKSDEIALDRDKFYDIMERCGIVSPESKEVA